MSELTQEQTVSPFIRVWRQRNFRLLWIGEGISLLGDQFYLIALPWLVLQMTGDALAVGGILAVASIPRALFMLVGGAVTDRFSPRTVMLGSNLVRMVVVALLALLVMSNLITLLGLYILTLVFGVVDAFFFPAQGAIIPRVVDKENLQIGNAIVQGTAQLSRFAGPILAGALITFLGSGETASIADWNSPDLVGIGYAFGFDALTFLVSAIALWMMQISKLSDELEPANRKENVWVAIRTGFFSIWNNVPLRTLFFLIIAINLLTNGPILVGIPVLADSYFAQGAATFGILMSTYGGGNLLGITLAGVLPRPASTFMGGILLVTMSVLGVGVALLGLISTLPFVVVILLIMGTANGYISILFVTWLQSEMPQAMLGRLMSVLMFAAMGLNPISMALAGFFMEIHPLLAFGGAGVMLLVIALLSTLNPKVRALGMVQLHE